MKRYEQLNTLIEQNKPKHIVEIGTWNGDRAIQMCREALKYNDNIKYTGFDLFEDATEDTDRNENNVKVHARESAVRLRLRNELPNVDVALIRGNTRQSLAVWSLAGGREAEVFVFIDGGHSIATVRSDFEHLKNFPVIVLDDYYVPDQEGHCQDTSKFGCNHLVEKYGMGLLPQKDPVQGGGYVQMAVYPRDKLRQKLVVKPKNCVPDDSIIENIAWHLDMAIDEIAPCRRHNETAIMCSAGPSLKEHIEQIKHESGYVVCVKHSHDTLIENGIIPWGCVLLDPRDHVSNFIETPHPDVRYFVASMCHPSTTKHLMEQNANIHLYHAAVGAGEEKLLNGKNLVCGGVSAAMRGISLFHALGFWKFKLYGYDLTYEGKPEKFDMTGAGQNQYWHVEIAGKKFHVDSEKIAQAQDFQNILKQERELDIEAFGDNSICRHMLETVEHKRSPVFAEFFA